MCDLGQKMTTSHLRRCTFTVFESHLRSLISANPISTESLWLNRRFWGFLNHHLCRGGWYTPPWVFFSEMTAKPLGGSRWNFAKLMGHPLRNYWRNKYDRSGRVNSQGYNVMRYSLRPIFQRNRVFSHVTWCHSKEWKYYALFRLADDHIWPLKFILTFLRGHPRAMTLADPIHKFVRVSQKFCNITFFTFSACTHNSKILLAVLHWKWREQANYLIIHEHSLPQGISNSARSDR